MRSKTFKKLTAMLLAVMLVFSMCVTAVSVSAAEGDTTYVVAGVTQLCGVGGTGYGWDPADTTNAMTANEDGTYTKVYTDVAVMNDYQLKVVGTDAAGTVTWYGIDGGNDNFTFHIVEVCDVTVTFDPATLKLTVTGDGVKIPTGLEIDAIRTVGNGDGTWLNGANWDPADASNTMTEVAPNVYEITYTEMEEFDNYQVKFAANGSWAINWGGVYAGSGVETDAVFNDSNNITFDVPYEIADVTITLDLTNFNYDDKTGAKYTITVVNTGDPIPTDPNPTDPEPTVPTDPVDVDYCLFGYINGANYGCEEDYANIGDYVFVDGTVTATFTETSYVAVKTTDNANWFMTDGWAGEVTEVTLYNTTTLGTTADKLMVPAGEVTFTLVENADGSLALSYTVAEEASVSVYGDINLELEETEADIYTGSIELQAGTYKFNVDNKGTTHGTNYTYTDTAVIDYSAGYKAATTLIVSGGRYTFSFNAATKKLTIKFKSFDDIVELVGDINAELVRPNKNTTVFTGTIRLEAGTYKFNVNEHGELFGVGNTFNDSIYNIPFVWKSAATFNATGGIYSVRYDASTNELKILMAPAGLGDVSIFGDISLPLAEQGNGVYSAQTILDAGSYDIRVDSFGTFFGNGTTFTDTINVEFKTEWKAAATLAVTEKMKFTFIFDTNTNKVKVFNAPIDTTKVKVAFDDIDALVLTSADGVTYTGTLALDAGTYTFRMDEFGTPMGGKYTFTDNSGNMVYNASYASATTMTATGGTYTFSYNVNTDALVVTMA